MYDVTFIGHMCYDEIDGRAPSVGSAVLCGAMVFARLNRPVAAIIRLNSKDEDIMLKPMKKSGIRCFLIPSDHTSYMKLTHPDPSNPDNRIMVQKENAGYFKIEDTPVINSQAIHLAGVTNQEFNLEYIKEIKAKYPYTTLSTDMQSFVRQVDPSTLKISYSDVSDKKDITSLMDRLKLDIEEAEVLTGTRDLEAASRIISTWGCPEVVITSKSGVLANVNNQIYFEQFSNSSDIGRTGRGDTTFAAYLTSRLGSDNIGQCLKFAAALVSLKMETPGPFSGTLNDVMLRIKEKHS